MKLLIGQKLPGRVEKVQVEPYQYVNPKTGEILTLDYSFVYTPDEQGITKEQLDYMQVYSSNFETLSRKPWAN
jgi:hypothetical protein